MAEAPTDKFSAGEQGLGYIYQARLALLQLLQLPEDTAVFLEKDDDLDFIDGGGGKSLASLKHKAVGDRLTDLSTDFWKSVNIWLARYKRDGRAASNLRFFLFTTGAVSTGSFLARLLPDQPIASSEAKTLTELADLALAQSTSKLIAPIATAFNELNDSEKQDFLERILILDGSPRIGDISGAHKGQAHAKRPARAPGVRLRTVGGLVDGRGDQSVDWRQIGRDLRLRSFGQALKLRRRIQGRQSAYHLPWKDALRRDRY